MSFAILRCPLKAVSGISASEFEQQIASALCLCTRAQANELKKSETAGALQDATRDGSEQKKGETMSVMCVMLLWQHRCLWQGMVASAGFLLFCI